MGNYTSDSILARMDELEILTRDNYTFVEYVEQLKLFQKEAAKIVVGEEAAYLVRMSEVISRCEALSREKNLYGDSRVTDGLRALRTINKELAVAFAGKHGEDRVANTFQYVTRPDAQFYRNIFITDGQEETEMDTVVLTKNGFIILEIKNAKEDITLAPDGRILFNNSSCYHDVSIGEKMDKKRQLLRQRLENEFARLGIEKEVKIDSFLVFSEPKGVRIHVHDQYGKEKYCFRGSLFRRIDGFRSNVEYTYEELALLRDIFQQIATEQKRFALPFDPEEIKKAFAEAVVVLIYEPETIVEETKRETIIRRKTVEKSKKIIDVLNNFSRPAVAASLVALSLSGAVLAPLALSGIAAGAISKMLE